MTWDRIEERLKQLKESARERWSGFADEDPEEAEARKRSEEWLKAIKEMAAVESGASESAPPVTKP